MSTKTTLALSVIAATTLAFVIGPALIQAASAVPAEKRVETTKCDDPKFADRESCPGKSEDAASDIRDDENVCVARNNGQAKDCPEGSEIVIVNPQ
jgi:hypothetical protein